MRLGSAAICLLSILLSAVTADAAIKKGPYLQSVKKDAVTVVWETDAALSGKLEWGTTQAYGTTATDAASNTMHAVQIQGLSPGTMYYYKIENDTTGGTFSTAPAPNQPFTFVVYGDNRTNKGDHQSVVDGIIAEAPALLINTGDLVETGSDANLWQEFFDIEKALLRSACVFPTVGNHEATWDPTVQQYLKWFYLPTSSAGGEKYYSFDWGNAHFAVLNSSDGLTSFSTNQQNWLKQDLLAAGANADIQHIFTVMHHGPYSAANHGDNAFAKTNIVPTLKSNGVDMTFAGHDHDYERGEVDGLRYMVAGGGGAPLYDSGHGSGTIYSEKTLHYAVFTVNGDRVDGCTKKPDGTVMECFGWGVLPQVDAGTPDAGHDAGAPDAGQPDTGSPDASSPDGALADATAGDATVVADASVDADQTGDDAQTPDDAGGEADGAVEHDASIARDGGGAAKDTGPILHPDDAATEEPSGEASGCSCTLLGL